MKYYVCLFLLFSSLMITSCNTMEGLGTDIKKGGQKLEQSAADNKGY